MFFTYILYSEKTDKYYIGHTSDLQLRIARHNDGWSKSTKSGIPWRIVYCEEYETKFQAMSREYEIKRKKSRIFIEKLVESAEGRPEVIREVLSLP